MPKQQVTQIDRAKKVLNTYEDEFKKKYATEGSAIGYKVKDRKYTDTISLIFYVRKKKSKKELSSEGIQEIPKEIDGIPTDVVARPAGIQPR
jgi:hypothetical protein